MWINCNECGLLLHTSNSDCWIVDDSNGIRYYYCTPCNDKVMDSITSTVCECEQCIGSRLSVPVVEDVELCEVCGKVATVSTQGTTALCADCDMNFSSCTFYECQDVVLHFQNSHMHYAIGVQV